MPYTKKKIKKLLLSGNSQSAIAKVLSIPRSRVNKIKKEIISDKIKWNQKHSRLENLRHFILHCHLLQLPARRIHTHLKAMGFHFSYSTVARFVSLLAGKRTIHQCKIPGDEAKVYLISAGKFRFNNQLVPVWVFVMKLSYSKYAYYSLIINPDIRSFLACHHRAFAFFNGVPHSVRVNKTNAFDLNDPVLLKKYQLFLKRNGSTLRYSGNRSCYFSYTGCRRYFKKNFLYRVTHKDGARFSKELKRWNAMVNLSIHPTTQKIIRNEFIQNEKNLLNPYDRKTNKAAGKKKKQ